MLSELISFVCRGLTVLCKAADQQTEKVKSLGRVWLFATPGTVACQAPPSMGFSSRECWSGLAFPSPGDLPGPGIEPGSPTLQADSLLSEPPGKQQLRLKCTRKDLTTFKISKNFFSLTGHEETCLVYQGAIVSASRSVVSNFATPQTVACQAPLSMGFSRQEYWSG